MDWKEVFVIILAFLILGIIICYTAFADNKQAQNVAKVLIIILVVLLVCFVIYELYMYYKRVIVNEPLLIDDAVDAQHFSKKFPAKQLPPSDIGSEFSYSFWIYIDNWDDNFNNFKHILSRSSAPPSNKDGDPNFTCTPGIWLYPKSSNLMVRFNTYNRKPTYAYYPYNGSNGIVNNCSQDNQYSDMPIKDAQDICDKKSDCAGIQIDRVTSSACLVDDSGELPPHTSNITKPYLPTHGGQEVHCQQAGGHCDDPGSQYCHQDGYCKVRYDTHVKTHSMNPDVSSNQIVDASTPCDVVQLPIQRWVHVAVVLWNRTADVYVNGKLNRSCVLDNVPIVNYKDDLYVLQNNTFNGKLAQLRYYNRALNATEVYSQYSKGPLHWSIFKAFEDLFPKTHTHIEVSGSAKYRD
jgi:hypothetical protein